VKLHNCEIAVNHRAALIGATESGKSVLMLHWLETEPRALYLRPTTHLQTLGWEKWPESIRARILPMGTPSAEGETEIDPKRDFTVQEALQHARSCAPCCLLFDDTQMKTASKTEREKFTAFRNAIRNEDLGIVTTHHALLSLQERRGLKHLIVFPMESELDEEYIEAKLHFPVFRMIRETGVKYSFAHWNKSLGWHPHYPVKMPGWLK